MTMLSELSIDKFLADLAAPQPTPGGGAVAALVGALAAGLGRMAAAYTLARPRESDAAELEELAGQLARVERHLRTLMDEDAAAYGALSAALKLPRDDPQRKDAVARAAAVASLVPLETASLSRRLWQALTRLGELASSQLRSDVDAARALARAAMSAALENVRANESLLGAADAATIAREVAVVTGNGDAEHGPETAPLVHGAWVTEEPDAALRPRVLWSCPHCGERHETEVIAGEGSPALAWCARGTEQDFVVVAWEERADIADD